MGSCLSALALVTTIACEVKVPEECQTICMHLDDCGLLKSSLGDTLPGCLAKCAASSAQSQMVFDSCLPSDDGFGEQPSSGGVTLKNWCEGGTCTMSSSCVSMIYGDDVVGASAVGYEPCVPDNGEIDSAVGVSMTDDVHASGSCTADELVSCSPLTDQTQLAVDEICKSFGLAEVRLESSDRIEVLATGPCSDVLKTRSTARDDIPPGLYGVTLTLRSGPLATDDCRKIYGERLILISSGSRTGRVFLPTVGDGAGHVHGCEDTDLTCFDDADLDEDADGASNCNDPDCQPACIETGPLCSDGLDNDGDQLIDCEDPNCVDQLVCTAPEGDTATGTG